MVHAGLQLNQMVLLQLNEDIHPIDRTSKLMDRTSIETIAHCTNKFVECFEVGENGEWKLENCTSATYPRRRDNEQNYNSRSDGPLCARKCAMYWGVSYANKKAVIETKKFMERFFFLERLKAAKDKEHDMDEGPWKLDFAIAMKFKEGNVLASLMASVKASLK